MAVKQLASNIKLFKVYTPNVARKAKPGNFVIVRVDEKGERIPLTIADFNPDKGTVTMIFQEVGVTTRKLGCLHERDYILNLMGPLGNPSEVQKYGRVVCVGGGIGIAALYPQAKALHGVGNEVVSIIGARTSELLILEDEMRKVSDELYVTTDDGSKGHHGFVTDVLKDLLCKGGINRVLAIGPPVMMRAVANMTHPYGIKTMVSLNPIVLDGTGMCGGCRVTIGGEAKFTCVHGPDFDGHLVNFELLMSRLQMYQDEEKTASERLKSSKGVE